MFRAEGLLADRQDSLRVGPGRGVVACREEMACKFCRQFNRRYIGSLQRRVGERPYVRLDSEQRSRGAGVVQPLQRLEYQPLHGRLRLRIRRRAAHERGDQAVQTHRLAVGVREPELRQAQQRILGP